MSVPSSLLRFPVEMPDRSGHNISHSVMFSGKTGTLIPVMCDELLPNDTVSLGSALQVQLPPMVTDFYGKVDFVLEAFFVPNRLCWGGWQDFITHPTLNPQYPEGTPVQAKPTRVPYVYVGTPGIGAQEYSVPVDSLLHYLDYGKSISPNSQDYVSVLPLIAYHRIWDDWYRDSRIQAPLFYRGNTDVAASSGSILSSLPYFYALDSSGNIQSIGVNTRFVDGVSFSSLRQRNWVKDYFTTASPLPQAGGAAEVKFDVSSSAETGAFSISTLRAANSLNLWRLS